MSTTENKPMGWGIVTQQGAEIWDAEPLFKSGSVSLRDKLMLFFYPKKFLLYRYLKRDIQSKRKTGHKYRILDVGCGTGAAVIDMKKLFGKQVEVVGIDVVHLQVDIAKKKLQKYGVWAQIDWFDGRQIPFATESFDAIYSSDVLGHVEDAYAWLYEIHRVLKPGGALAMFAESELGKHAYIRNYLMKRGLNTDPHKQFHISLFSKDRLRSMLQVAGFDIKVMYTTVWATFFVHPDEMYAAFQEHGGFFLLRHLNASLHSIKKKTHPYSTAAAELYSLAEMLTVGRWVESQGYIILGKKKN